MYFFFFGNVELSLLTIFVNEERIKEKNSLLYFVRLRIYKYFQKGTP